MASAWRSSGSAATAVAAHRGDEREIVQRRRGVRVLGAARLDVGVVRLAEQRLGAGEIAVEAQHGGKIALADGSLAVPGAEHLPADVQRLAVQRLRPLIQSLVLIDPSELRERDGDVRMLRAEQLPAHRQRFLEPLPGGTVVALVREHGPQVVERLRHLRVLVAEDLTAARQRLLEQLLRLVERRQPPIGPPHRRQHLDLELGLARELLLHLCRAGVEHGADARRLSRCPTDDVRIGAGQQAHHQLADLDGLRRLALGAIALRGETSGVDTGQSRHEQHHGRRAAHTARMPPDEPCGPIRRAYVGRAATGSRRRCRRTSSANASTEA